MTHRWQTLLAIDFDRWACATYSANFPGVRVECGPVADYIDRLPDTDVVLGGPPCQPHSHAGKRLASADARDCGPDFVAAVAKVQPRHFLMENVPGLLSSENGRYFRRLSRMFDDAGYECRMAVLDAVSFGVPQFRERLWVWGIRHDLYAAGLRHRFPKPTHAWPPPGDCMFGGALLPGVTVGQALGLDGAIRKPRSKSQIRRDHPTDEPCPTVEARASLGGGSCLKLISGSKCRKDSHGIPRGPLVKSVENPSFAIDGTPPSLRVYGGGMNPHFAGEARTERDITDEPSTTIAAGHTHNALPAIHENGTGASEPWRLDRPSTTVLSHEEKGAKHHPRFDPTRTPASASDGLYRATGIRRLTPLNCLRLQSGPDDFKWPEGVTKTAMYKIVGNGWACGMGWHMSQAIAAADPDARTVTDLFCGGGLGACGWHGRYWSYQPEGIAVA